jgi:transposase
MPIVAEKYGFVIGVDTNAASHALAVITAATTAVVAQSAFPATVAGLSRAVSWAARRAGEPAGVLIVVEGVGSYGAPVARAFTAAGYRVVEAGAQPRADRRGKGKSDALDAVRIARSVVGTDTGALRVPRADGVRNALRILAEVVNPAETVRG